MTMFRLNSVLALSLTLGLGFSTTALADQVQIPVGQQGGAQSVDQVPTNGMTQERVEARFGAPQQRRSAVGDPPISSWVYEDYVVYFEHDRVLRTVLKHRSQAGAEVSSSNGG